MDSAKGMGGWLHLLLEEVSAVYLIILHPHWAFL